MLCQYITLAVSGISLLRGGHSIALVEALNMVVIVIVGSVIGMLLPFVLARLNFDPAAASAPLITSICDGVGVLIYFNIANLVLSLPPRQRRVSHPGAAPFPPAGRGGCTPASGRRRGGG